MSKPMEEDIVEDILQLEEEMHLDDTGGTGAAQLLPPRPQVKLCVGGNVCTPSISCPPLYIPSTSCPPFHPMNSKACLSSPVASLQLKDRRRKQRRNVFERKRRCIINDRIRELAALLPSSNEQHYDLICDLRPTTGQILEASVNYIQRLKVDMEHHKFMEAERLALERENQRLRVRVEELEERLRPGVPAPPPHHTLPHPS
ncbi:transcription factor E3-like [Procambarus clarkii]|uniref:transcription factor E3-like n=1 Tax=Procambarus clarkii TaxID=6728 RepID=UPI001E676807|nr:transcription factor E3-like [Procambarus clarkii]